jgi:hypothetical protein
VFHVAAEQLLYGDPENAGRVLRDAIIHGAAQISRQARSSPLSSASHISSPISPTDYWRKLRLAQSLVRGFLSELLAGAEPRAARIMSMKARRPAGTCRCPG